MIPRWVEVEVMGIFISTYLIGETIILWLRESQVEVGQNGVIDHADNSLELLFYNDLSQAKRRLWNSTVLFSVSYFRALRL